MGANAAWEGEKPKKLGPDGKSGDPSHAIILVEVTNSGIAWTEVSGHACATGGNSASLAVSSHHGRREQFFFTYDYDPVVSVAMADGSVRFLRLGDRSADDLRKLLQVRGCGAEEAGEPVRRPNWPNIASLAVWLLSVGILLTRAVRSRKRLPIPSPPA